MDRINKPIKFDSLWFKWTIYQTIAKALLRSLPLDPTKRNLSMMPSRRISWSPSVTHWLSIYCQHLLLSGNNPSSSSLLLPSSGICSRSSLAQKPAKTMSRITTNPSKKSRCHLRKWVKKSKRMKAWMKIHAARMRWIGRRKMESRKERERAPLRLNFSNRN